MSLQVLILQELPSGIFSDPYELQQLKISKGTVCAQPKVLDTRDMDAASSNCHVCRSSFSILHIIGFEKLAPGHDSLDHLACLPTDCHVKDTGKHAMYHESWIPFLKHHLMTRSMILYSTGWDAAAVFGTVELEM